MIAGSTISVFYDPLISKIIAFGQTRDQAIDHLQAALCQTVTLGLVTNKHYITAILNHAKFRDASFNTHFIDTYLPQGSWQQHCIDSGGASHNYSDFAIAATLWQWSHAERNRRHLRHVPSGWRNNRYTAQRRTFSFHKSIDQAPITVEYVHNVGSHKHRQAQSNALLFSLQQQQQQQQEQERHAVNHSPGELFHMRIGQLQHRVILYHIDATHVVLAVDGHRKQFIIAADNDGTTIHIHACGSGVEHSLQRVSRFASGSNVDEGCGELPYVSLMPARILNVLKADGEQVQAGDTVIVMESMKMESKISALKAGTVRVFVSKDSLVDAGTQLFNVEEDVAH
jgi:acetyl/propionyl-CoA carboxylase alpha subunit